ncbi:MAG TPA: amidohydrolase family protein [Longimicrobium sp.]|nr:amidohydrolase family protein [Longimicrobium sp.]
MKRSLFIAATILFTATGGVRAQATAPAPLAITHAAVIDVESGRTLADQTVVVQGSRITSVGPAASVAVPQGARVVDGRGKYVIPGLWDMHVHAAFPGLDRMYMPLLAANGVTGVREMFSRLDFVDSTRARVARGEIVGPRMIAAGHILDGAPPLWPASVVARNADEARRAVDSLANAGAQFIKVYSRLTPEAFHAAADQAKRRGIPFAGHVPSLVTAAAASDAGIATIEHLTGLVGACSPLDPASRGHIAAAVASPRGWDSAGKVSRAQATRVLASYNPAECRAIAQRLARNGTVMVPTLVTLRATSALDDTTLAHDHRLRYVPRMFAAQWNPRADFRFSALTAEDWQNRRALFERQMEVARVLHQNGVRFMAGTDLSNPYTFAGFSLHEELEMLTRIGLTPLQALQAATLEPARFLKMTDSAGTVAQGKTADLVVLAADPLADIRNVARIHAVVLNGRLIDAAERERILSTAEAMAAGRPTTR